MIFERANRELKLINDESKRKNKILVEGIFKKVGKRFMNKIYEYLMNLDDEDLPKMIIQGYQQFESMNLDKWKEKTETQNIDYVC